MQKVSQAQYKTKKSTIKVIPVDLRIQCSKNPVQMQIMWQKILPQTNEPNMGNLENVFIYRASQQN